jgi:hypothetical protein
LPWPIPLWFAFLVCALASVPASAGDGVIEINAAAAQRGGVTTGDTPGFPVTLSKSGSYRLTGDLVSSSKAVSLIDITADGVSLDLNGFTVGACLGGGVCGTGTADAITAGGQSLAHIHGGVVRGAGYACVRGGTRAVIEDLRISGCDGDGIVTGSHARIARVHVSDVEEQGVDVQIGSVLQDSIVTGSGSYGVTVYFSALVVDSLIDNNAGAIGATGFSGATKGGYRGCVITRNAGTDEEQSISPAMRDLGGNTCGSDTVCP